MNPCVAQVLNSSGQFGRGVVPHTGKRAAYELSLTEPGAVIHIEGPKRLCVSMEDTFFDELNAKSPANVISDFFSAAHGNSDFVRNLFFRWCPTLCLARVPTTIRPIMNLYLDIVEDPVWFWMPLFQFVIEVKERPDICMQLLTDRALHSTVDTDCTHQRNAAHTAPPWHRGWRGEVRPSVRD